MSPFYGSPKDAPPEQGDGPFYGAPRTVAAPLGPMRLRIHHEPRGEPFIGTTVYCVGTFTLHGEPVDPGEVKVLVRPPGGKYLNGLEVEHTELGAVRVAIEADVDGLWLCRLWTEAVADQHDFVVRG